MDHANLTDMHVIHTMASGQRVVVVGLFAVPRDKAIFCNMKKQYAFVGINGHSDSTRA